MNAVQAGGASALVPAPLVLRVDQAGPFVVGPETAVVVGPGDELLAVGVGVADLLGRRRGHAVPVRVARPDEPAAAGAVVIQLSAADSDGLPAGDEAYRLSATADAVHLVARTSVGLQRAVATLRQLLTDDETVLPTIPAVLVEDAPRYAWRGLSVDVARHMVAPDDLRRILDLLAAYKLNALHLHLTDDQAWRLDLPSRPELVVRSSGASVGGDPGGHYTADDWAALLAHAVARGVTVVPEIDVPGHVNAALHAYGELVPGGEPVEEYLGVEVGFSRLTAALPATAVFLEDVLGDLAAMTPGEYLHIGGDEALTLDGDDYAALTGAAARVVRAHGKRVVGWQEIAAAPLEPGTVVQLWDVRADTAPVVAAVAAGALLLASPAPHAYLDLAYGPGFPLGQDWAGYVDVRDAYDWDPATVLPGVDPAAVIGVEAAVWTETLRTFDDLMTMLLPRLAAVAEVAWSAPDRRDWEGFRVRLAGQAAPWDALGLAWYRSSQIDWPA